MCRFKERPKIKALVETAEDLGKLEDKAEKASTYFKSKEEQAIQAELESRGIEILSSGFERIPQVTKVLTSDHVADVDKLLEKLKK